MLCVCIFFGIYLCLSSAQVYAQEMIDIPGSQTIKDVSLKQDFNGSDISWNLNSVFLDVLIIAQRILLALLVIFIVYTGVMMIISMGTDDEKLSASKRQLWYSLVALIFVLLPWQLYNAFGPDRPRTSEDLLINTGFFQSVTQNIILMLQVVIFAGAIFMISLVGLRLIASRWNEEMVTEAKNKIIYGILALIFVGVIEAWKRVAIFGSVDEAESLFESLANVALFFAAPIAIFFLTLAWYYYITSNGDEERSKKAKTIITHTLIATLILIASYTFLLELRNLFP